VEAAEVAVERAGTGLDDIGLIVNAGIYRDENICEPAMAPFIQRAIERRAGRGAEILSFDLADGACGMWTATRVAAGFIESGVVDRALVVSSDIDPTPEVSRGWTFDAVGGAFVLARGAPDAGFSAFHSETFAKHSNQFEAHVPFIGSSTDPPCHTLRISQTEDFTSACGHSAATAISHFSNLESFEIGALELIVPSASPAGFAAALADAAGFAPGALERDVGRGLDSLRPHTAGPAFALEAVLETDRYRDASEILFVAAGAGISVSLGLYRKERGA
jgi:3-oxoacyl-[acyl-carrier-protein] synthase-3